MSRARNEGTTRARGTGRSRDDAFGGRRARGASRRGKKSRAGRAVGRRAPAARRRRRIRAHLVLDVARGVDGDEVHALVPARARGDARGVGSFRASRGSSRVGRWTGEGGDRLARAGHRAGKVFQDVRKDPAGGDGGSSRGRFPSGDAPGVRDEVRAEQTPAFLLRQRVPHDDVRLPPREGFRPRARHPGVVVPGDPWHFFARVAHPRPRDRRPPAGSDARASPSARTRYASDAWLVLTPRRFVHRARASRCDRPPRAVQESSFSPRPQRLRPADLLCGVGNRSPEFDSLGERPRVKNERLATLQRLRVFARGPVPRGRSRR